MSLIIPARNEARCLRGTLQAALEAVEFFRRSAPELDASAEIIVVDNQSDDGTWELLGEYARDHGIRPMRLAALGAARARNQGGRQARGAILIFIDADTQIPEETISRIMEHCHQGAKQGGITGLAGLEGGWRAWCWWQFWGQVRRFPLARAKAMPALMFCTATAFHEFGPFDEEVAIGEEWPILAGLYRARPQQFIYDRTLVARTSSRRMEQQRFGYLRTFLKYVWAILHHAGRIEYTDQIR
ncbi:MAG: glycosyltransferase [Planctomycetales bacterium]